MVRASPTERDALLAGAAALAAPVLGLEAEPLAAVPGEEFTSMHGLYWLACNLAARRPLLLVVDDAQWSDEISLRWLLYLAQRIEGLRISLLIAVRSDEPDGGRPLLEALAAEPAADLARPAALSEEATTALLCRLWGEAVEPALGRACREWTGGNPWFLAELGAELAGSGLGSREDGPARLRELIPDDVARVTLLRLQRLPESALELARAAAILGSGAELREAAALAGLGDDAIDACDSLVEARVLEPGRPLRFVHPMVRGVVYEALPGARRAVDHLRAARLFDRDGASPERVAAHLLLSHPSGDEWVVQRLRAAADLERARGSHAAAVLLLARALQEPPPAAARPQLLFELGSEQFLVHDPAAVATLELALAAAAEPPSRAAVAIALGRLLIFAGRAREALARIDEALPGLKPDSDARLELEALRLAAATSDLELLEVAEEQTERLMSVPRPSSRGGRMANVLLSYQAAIAGEPAAETAALARLALADGLLLHDSLDSPDAFVVSISMLAICDELEEAERHYTEVTELCRASGRALGFALASCFRSWTSNLLGRLAEAELQARDALAFADASPALATAVGGFAAAHLAQTLIERDELVEAAAVLERAEGGAAAEPPMTWARSLAFAGGLLLAARGRHAEAAEALLSCGRLHQQAGIVNPAVVPWRSQAALALQRAGEGGQARRLATEELELARRFGAPRPIGVALRAAGLVEGGEPGLAMLSESVAVLRESPARLELAHSSAALGAALRRAGRRSQAREALGEGLELALSCTMERLAEEARSELRLLGSRPRSELRSGAGALTPAERRVAEMAAGGMSNPEIAQALFVTRATVESHLHAAYRKLGIGSRDQLGDALGESQ